MTATVLGVSRYGGAVADEVGFAPLFQAHAPLRDLRLGRLRLAQGEPRGGSTGEGEKALHVLCGRVAVAASGPWGACQWRGIGDRRCVFSGAPTTVVLPPESSYDVRAETPFADVLVAGAPLTIEQAVGMPPGIVRPADVRTHRIGRGTHRRLVREVLGERDRSPARRLFLGETVNRRGGWSSWPAHHFELDTENAPSFEEAFVYFTSPREGEALQERRGRFCTDEEVDDVVRIRNGDAAVIPLGSHGVVGRPDTKVLYVWAYVGPEAKCYARFAEHMGGYR